MKKYLSQILVAVIILIAIVVMIFLNLLHAKVAPQSGYVPFLTASSTIPITLGSGPLDTTYVIDHTLVKLVKGKAGLQSPPPHAVADADTEVFGKPVYGDIGAGKDSAVMFLSQETGGTGIFFYVVGAYSVNGTYTGTQGFFIGDRITPGTITIKDGEAEVTYKVRNDSDPYTVAPSVTVTKHFAIKNRVLVEK